MKTDEINNNHECITKNYVPIIGEFSPNPTQLIEFDIAKYIAQNYVSSKDNILGFGICTNGHPLGPLEPFICVVHITVPPLMMSKSSFYMGIDSSKPPEDIIIEYLSGAPKSPLFGVKTTEDIPLKRKLDIYVFDKHVLSEIERKQMNGENKRFWDYARPFGITDIKLHKRDSNLVNRGDDKRLTEYFAI